MANDIKAKIEILFDDKELKSKLNSIKKESKIEIEAKISSQDVQKISAQLDTIKKKSESTGNSLQAYINKLNAISSAIESFKGSINAANEVSTLLTKISQVPNIGNAIKSIGAKDFIMNSDNLTNALKGLDAQQMTTVLSSNSLQAALGGLSRSELELALYNAGLTKEQAENTVSTITMSVAQGTATGTTWSLSSAFKGLSAAIAANPLGSILTVLTIGISALTSAASKYKQKQQELLVNAQNSTSALEEETSAINEQINSITEQRKLLESSNITDEEAANVKSQLLEIQNSIIDSYGREAEGLDLVNGKLEDQINILQNITKGKASQWLTENRSAIETATKKMEAKEDYNLGYAISPSTDVGSAIMDIAKDFEEHGIKVDQHGLTYMFTFHGDAKNAENVILDFSSKIRELQNEFGEDDIGLKNLLDSASASYNKAQGILDENQKLYEGSIVNRAIDSGATSELFMDYINAISEYDKALTNRDGVEEAKANFETIKTSIIALSEQYPFLKKAIELVDEEFSISTKSMVNSAFETLKTSVITLSEKFPFFRDAIALVDEEFSISSRSMVDSANDVNDALNKETNIWSISDAIIELDKLSNSMSTLDSAYAKLSANEKIDTSDLTALQEAFGELDGFEDFVNIATSATSVTKDVQDAFDKLSKQYINSSGILDYVNDSTKNVIISQLKLNGVSNAEAIVMKRLTNQKNILAETGIDVANATTNEIIELSKLETISDNTRLALVDLAIQKTALNNTISTKADIQNLLDLAAIANVTGDSLVALKAVQEREVGAGGPGDLENLIKRARAELYLYYETLGGAARKEYNSDKNKPGDKVKQYEMKEETPFSDSIDWSKSSIEELNRAVSNAKDAVDKNNPYSKQIEDITTLISLQKKLTDGYKKQEKTYNDKYEKSLKGIEKYRDKIESGAEFKIEDFNGEDREKDFNQVNEAREYYKQYIDARDNKLKTRKSRFDELNRVISDAKIDKNDPYSKQIEDINTLISLQNILINGYKNQTPTYESEYTKSLIGIEKYKDKIESGGELDIKDFKGDNKAFGKAKQAQEKYKLYKDALYDETQARNSRDENRQEKKVIKIKADYEEFDKQLSDVNKVLSEIDFNVDFVDEGSIEHLVLLQSGYEQSSKSAKMLRSEISKLDKQYAQGKIDLKTYTERVEDLNKKELDAVKSMKKYQDNIISAVKNRYDKELDLSKKALEKKLEDIETERKAKIEALENEIKKYKEIIDAQKKALKDQQETDDYNEQVAKFNTEISKMESRISLLKKAELTGDREAGKERKQLEDDLAKKKEELAKLQKERGIDLAIDALDEEYDAYEKMKNQEIKDTEKKYENEKIEAQNAYDLKESNLNKLYENEKRLIIEAASLTKEKFTEAFDEINRVLSQYGMSASPELSDLFNDTQKSVSRTATDMLLRTGTGTTGNSELNQYIKSKYGSYLSYSEMVELAKMLNVTGINTTKDVQGTTSNRTKILNALKKAGFAEGGYVLDDYMARKVGEHRVVLARNGEALFPENKAILFKELINNIKPLNSLVKLSIPNMSNLVANNNSSPVINFNLNGGTITTEVMPQFNKWKSDIANEVSKIIMGGARQK